MQTDDFEKKRGRQLPVSRLRGRPIRFCDGDDLAAISYDDADWYDDDDDWGSRPMHELPAAVRAHRARQRLERHLERRRLMAELADGFDVEPEGGRGDRRRTHRQRAKRGKMPPAP